MVDHQDTKSTKDMGEATGRQLVPGRKRRRRATLCHLNATKDLNSMEYARIPPGNPKPGAMSF